MASTDDDSRDSGVSSDGGLIDKSIYRQQTAMKFNTSLSKTEDCGDVEMGEVTSQVSLSNVGITSPDHITSTERRQADDGRVDTPFIFSSGFPISVAENSVVDFGSAMDIDCSSYADELDVSMRDASSVFSATPAQSPFDSMYQSNGEQQLSRRTGSEQQESYGEGRCFKGKSTRSLWGEGPSVMQSDRSFRKRPTETSGAEIAVKREKGWTDCDKRLVTIEKAAKWTRTQSSGILEMGPIAMSRLSDSELPSCLEVTYSLKTVARPQVDLGAFKSISAETLCSLLEVGKEKFSERFLLVDCRYPYEFNGGHIRGAINMPDPTMVSEIFFPSNQPLYDQELAKIPIFYCEFSQKRGPTMAYALRAFDRLRNEDCYPLVDYKEIYIVDKGYQHFYRFAKNYCEPSDYVTMVDVAHASELRDYRFHRSKSMCSIDGTVSKERGMPVVRMRRNATRSVRNVCSALPPIVASPQEQESPTQFPGHSSALSGSTDIPRDRSRLPPLLFD